MSEKVRTENIAIHGFAIKGFEAVREAFAENFIKRHELGAACCIYYRGEKAVDLWGGVRNKATGELWEEDTMDGTHFRRFARPERRESRNSERAYSSICTLKTVWRTYVTHHRSAIYRSFCGARSE